LEGRDFKGVRGRLKGNGVVERVKEGLEWKVERNGGWRGGNCTVGRGIWSWGGWNEMVQEILDGVGEFWRDF
jgi:hypothetical protein